MLHRLLIVRPPTQRWRQLRADGRITKQVDRAIRLHDVVVVVLSKWSVNSDWVDYELKSARKKEKDERRDVLCPVALDDSWKAKVDSDPNWGHLANKLVVDFSGWKTFDVALVL